jgi:alpha-D-xyloside xylohydrolase
LVIQIHEKQLEPYLKVREMKVTNKKNKGIKRNRLVLSLLIFTFSLLGHGQTRISTWIHSSIYRVPDNIGTGLATTEEKVISSYLEVIPYGENIFRIIIKPDNHETGHPSLVVLQAPPDIEAELVTINVSQRLKTNAGSVEVNTRNGSLKFYNASGKEVLMTPESHPFRFDSVLIEGEKTMKVQQRFVLGDEALYGLGQLYRDDRMNWRGQTRVLVQGNHDAINPTLTSTGGWGLFWDNYSRTIFRDGEDGMSLSSEVGDKIDFYVFFGDDLDEVIAAYRKLTGKAPMFPKWAYGYFQSKQRYMNSDDLLSVARKFREMKIPIDVIVQDWQYWGDDRGLWSSMNFNPDKYPDPQRTLDQLHKDLNTHYMISIWPVLGNKTEIYKAMDKNGWLSRGEIGWFSGGKLYDAYNEDARKLYWDYIRDGLMKYGVDALWMDATEPERVFTDDREVSESEIIKWGPTSLGSRSRYLNPYSLVTCEGVYEGWRNDIKDKRVFILTRSSFAGQQRTASATWSGDIYSTWEVMHSQIAAGLNFSLSGLPYWTFDIGGFLIDDAPYGLFDGFNGDYGELYTRWLEFGTFLPIFRSHGDHRPREPWQFGKPGEPYYNAILKYMNIRYRLMPYIYSWAWKVTSENATLLRALPMDFPEDKKTWNINDEFLLGNDFLVAPVTTPVTQGLPRDGGVSVRTVYLPKGADWTNIWTGEVLKGGREITVKADIAMLPLFLRVGAIVPMGPYIQYTTEKPDDPLEIRIVTGADGQFTLYEDENDNYNYERGTFATINFKWENATRRLTIGERKGQFPGMLEKRVFRIVLTENGKVKGFQPVDKPDRQILYDGKAIQTNF